MPQTSSTVYQHAATLVLLIGMQIMFNISITDLVLFFRHLSFTFIASSAACIIVAGAICKILADRIISPETLRWWKLRRKHQVVGIAIAMVAAIFHCMALKLSFQNRIEAHRYLCAGFLAIIIAVNVAYGAYRLPSRELSTWCYSVGLVVGCIGTLLLLFPSVWDSAIVLHMSGMSIIAVGGLFSVLNYYMQPWVLAIDWNQRNGHRIVPND